MEHLHDSADDPFEVVMTRLDIVPLEPSRARERMTVGVEGGAFAGPNPAPHVLGASRTRHTEVGCVHLGELITQAPGIHQRKRVDELARVVVHHEEGDAAHVLPVERLEVQF